NRKSEALELLKKIRTSYPNNDSYFSALWLEADIYRKNKEYTKSIDVLSLLIKMLSEQLSDRDELVKAYYWRGKNYEASGMLSNAARDFNEVIIRHPMSFYAYRSATKLKMIYAKLTDALNRESFRNYANYNKEDGEIIRMIERILKGNREQENNRFSQFNEFREFDFRDVETEQFPNDKYKNSFYKFYVLRMLRLYDEAIRELEFVMQVKENNPKYIYTLANIYTEADNIRKAIEVVEQMINKFGEKFSLTSMPRRLKTILYPQFYSDIVTFNSARNDVDPYLVFSIIREESRFRTFAVSRAGAQGLMQIMPATGRWIANKMGIPYYRHADLNIPHINVKMGAWYFSYLTKRNKNNLILSLAAYNGGQANVDKWLKEINVDDIDEFVEKIPFRETRNYVKKVMTSYNIYKQIYDNGYNIELTSIETAFSNERLK
ncbi:MAG TPA: transglycosylase SLT domain-containing protein, partial [bacterium]|nr:transglycosylase SLT domain-containing protein [bacterium]